MGYRQLEYTLTNASGQVTGNTLITDSLTGGNKTITYLFDGYGRTIGVTNQAGQTQYALYGSDTTSIETRNQFNKIAFNSELQTIANNLVKNHGFEQTAYWTALQTTTEGSYGYNTDEHSGGSRSMMMELTGSSGVFEVDQDFAAEAGETYTVSVDIKIPQDLTLTGNSGVMFGFVYCVNGVWQTDGSEWIAATTGNEWLDPELSRGWQRFTHTMTLPSGNLTNCHVFIELARAIGTAHFDNIQVEKSGGARYYNFVENSDFSNAPGATSSPTGTAAYRWTMSGTQTNDGVQVANGRNYILMTGSPVHQKKITQSVPVNADAGDVLIIGGKAAAYATIDTDNNRKFGIIAEIYSTATTKADTITIDFDRSINMEHQTKATSYTLTTPCHHVVYSFVYYKHVDGVSFDDAFIYVGNFGEHYEYDDDGQLNKVVNDDNDKATSYTYDNNDIVAVDQTISGIETNVASFIYENHNVTTITNNSGTEIYFEYDDDGQVTSQMIKENDSGNDPLTKTESMTYIQAGNYLKTFTDAKGGVTTYTYDNNDLALKGLVVKVEDPEGNETNYTYDPYSDELLSTTGYANPSTPSVTNFACQDYLPETVTRNNTTYSYDYDNQNRVTAAKVGNQTLVTNTYDNRHRLAQQNYANQAVYTPVYDSRDRLIGDSWNNVQTTKYFYNENDRLSQFVDNTTGITYKYDYAFYGLVNRINGSNGTKTAYDYTSTGQLSHLMFSKNNDTIYKARYQTNGKGNPEDVIITSLGNTLLHYNYDGLNRLTGNSCGPLITERTYCAGTGTNSTSNLVEEYTNKNDAGVLQQYEYEYDLNSNITEITETQTAETSIYTYDGLNRLTGESGPYGAYCYNYDVGGNLTTVTNGDGTVVYNNYTYGNTNWKDQLTSIDNNAITYDSSGNPLTYNGVTFTWQRGRQLTGISDNQINISYTYDAQGHRTSQTIDEMTLTYTYSGDLLMRQSDGTNTLDFQYDAGGIAVGFNYNGTPYFYARNLQGDVVAVIDADGTIVAEYSYDAWGNITAASGAMVAINPIRYRGYYQDPVTGWYFLQSRYYLPEWRRFLNADSLFVAGDAITGSNMYAYCNGNPVMYADPSGMGVFGDALGNAIRVRNKVTSWLLLPVTYLVVAPASNVLLYATRNIVGEDPVEKIAPFLKSGAEDILPKVPPILKPGPSTIPTGLRHFMPINMAFGAPWAGYFLGFETSTYRKGLLKFKNYTTVETEEGIPKPMWQSQVGYDELYDFFFSLGGPIERIRYKFEEGTGSNKKYYAIWLWKGDYWNLGAGAEIGIYYTGNEDNAENNFYIIEESLTLHVHMVIKYNELGFIPLTLNDFHQTNWWVCSFTPAIQFPNVDWIDVDLDVRFTGSNYHKLMKPFYIAWDDPSYPNREKVTMLPTAYKTRAVNHTTHKCSCDHPTLCTCSWTCCSNPCRYYTNTCDTSCSHYGDNENGFQFKITY